MYGDQKAEAGPEFTDRKGPHSSACWSASRSKDRPVYCAWHLYEVIRTERLLTSLSVLSLSHAWSSSAMSDTEKAVAQGSTPMEEKPALMKRDTSLSDAASEKTKVADEPALAYDKRTWYVVL